MRNLLLVIGLAFSAITHAEIFDGEILNKWFDKGVSQGIDSQGRPCQVVLENFENLGTSSLKIKVANDPSELKAGRFNSGYRSTLEEINENDNSLRITVENKAYDDYSADLRQTLDVQITSNGKLVKIIEKELRLFGSTIKANCLIK